ncbi:hypothetical protein LY76DRAFT_400296 [Colletotrichum caudatum]|nr:hypothetical protein LY76DRAFT_400296 [Colletotrichum caudatum]
MAAMRDRITRQRNEDHNNSNDKIKASVITPLFTTPPHTPALFSLYHTHTHTHTHTQTEAHTPQHMHISAFQQVASSTAVSRAQLSATLHAVL